MKKHKILSFILVLCMVFSLMPVSVYAETDSSQKENYFQSTPAGENVTKDEEDSTPSKTESSTEGTGTEDEKNSEDSNGESSTGEEDTKDGEDSTPAKEESAAKEEDAEENSTEEEAGDKVIVSFQEYKEEYTCEVLEQGDNTENEWENQAKEEADTIIGKFPSSLTAEIKNSGDTKKVPVTWKSSGKEFTSTKEAGSYTFKAEIGDGYTLEDGVKIPSIKVTVEDSQTAYEKCVKLFEALPKEGITEETTKEEKEVIYGKAEKAMEALEALSEEEQAKFEEEHADLLELAYAICDAYTGNLMGMYEATETADFTIGNGESALTLLNAQKNDGADDSTWDNATKTLTLNGVNFSTTAATAVKLPDGTTIQLKDGTENTIKSTQETGGNSYGIKCGSGYDHNSGLTISGAGTLKVYAGNVGEYNATTEGVYCYGSIQVTNASVEVTGGVGNGVDDTTTLTNSYGMHLQYGCITVNTSGSIQATSGTATRCYGINTVDMKIEGSLIAKGGNFVNDSYGVIFKENLTVAGGTLEATGGNIIGNPSNGNNVSYGVYGGNSSTLYVTDGTLQATGGTLSTTNNYNGRSYGISGTTFTISGGAVIASTLHETKVNLRYEFGAIYKEPTYSNYTPSVTAGTSESDAALVETLISDTYQKRYVKIIKACNETADFTTGNGVSALALLNRYKTAGASASTWNDTSKTLTLNGVNFNTSAATAVKLPGGTTIKLTEGTKNTIKSTQKSGYTYGIYSCGDLSVSGIGTLYVENNSENGAGIYSTEGITISEGTVITDSIDVNTGMLSIEGGIVTASVTSTESEQRCAIHAKNGGIKISGGTVTATVIGTGNAIKTNGGAITISGGTVTATGGNANSTDIGYGIISDVTGNSEVGKDIIISGGTVTAESEGKAGICSKGSITISGGKVTAKGGTVVNSGHGIHSKGSITISGGTVTATATANYGYGIYSQDAITISGGTVTATANYGYGIYSKYTATISGGTVTAKATADNGRSINMQPDFADFLEVKASSSDVSSLPSTDYVPDNWKGYRRVDSTYKKVNTTVTIDGKVGATVALPNIPSGAEYSVPGASGDVTMTSMSIRGNTLTYTAPQSTKGKIGKITVPVSATADHEGYNVEIIVTYTARLITIPTIDNSSYTYNGKSQIYQVASSSDYTITGNTAIDAGDHTVTISLNDKTNTEWDNHESNDITRTFTIEPATPSLAWVNETQSVIYTGSEASFTDPEVTGVSGGTTPNGAISYQYKKSTEFNSAYVTGLPVNAGTYKVKAHIKAKGNYKEADSSTPLTLTIEKATPGLTINSMNGKTYDGTAVTRPTANQMSITGADYNDVAFFYADNENMTKATSSAPVNAGTYYVQAKVSETDNTKEKTSNVVSFIISKAPLTITGGTAESRAYNGTPIANVTELTFSGLKNNETLAISTDYTVTAAFGNVDAGENKPVSGTASLVSNARTDNYTLTGSFTNITGTVTAKAVTSGTVTVNGDYIYTGSEIKPTDVTVKDGETVIPADNYDLSYTDNVNASNTAAVLVTLKNNYSGSAGGTFTIQPKQVTPDVTVTGSYSYTGSEIKPTDVMVKDGETVIESRNYDLSYTDNTNVGTATVTVTLKKNYKGTGTETFIITAAKPIVTVSAQKKQELTLFGISIGNHEDTIVLKAVITGVSGGTTPAGTVTLKQGNATLAENVAVSNGTASYDWVQPDAKDSYTVTAYFTAATGTNYQDAEGTSEAFCIDKAAQKNLTITEVPSKTYGDSSFTLTITGGSGNGAVTYAATGTTDVISVESTGTVTILKTGTAYVTATKAGDDNYNSVTSVPLTITVSPADTGLAWADNAEETLIYTGWEAVITNLPGVTGVSGTDKSNGEVTYAYKKNTQGLQGLFSLFSGYTDGLPTDAGTYDVKAHIKAEGNYKEADSSNSLTLTIQKADMNISAENVTETYDRAGHSISIIGAPAGAVITYGKTVGAYQLTENPSYVNAGSYTTYYKITKSNYNDYTGSAAVTINKKPLTQDMLTVRGTYTYTGMPQEAEYSLKDGGYDLVKDTEYTVGYTDNTNAGSTAKVTAAGTGNYSGSISKMFTIGKKHIIAKPDDFTINSNQSFPTFTWKVETGIEGETITADNVDDIAMEIQENGSKVNSVKAGKFDIVFTTAPDFSSQNNYQVTAGTGTLTVNQYTAPSSGGSSGSSSSGSSSSSSTPAVTPAGSTTVVTEQGKVVSTGNTDAKGNTSISVAEKTVTEAYNKALAEAKKTGSEQKGITLTIQVKNSNVNAESFTVSLPKATQEKIIKNQIVNTVLVVDHPDIQIELDLAAVKAINEQAKADARVTAAKFAAGNLSDMAQAAIGDRPVYDVKISYGKNQVSQFGTGRMSVEIPYTLKPGEKADNVYAVYVDPQGKVEWLTDSIYDAVRKTVRFTTGHCSIYGVAYDADGTIVRQQVIEPASATQDTESIQTYTVKKGDSWWKIARKYKVSMFDLAKENNKTIFTTLHIGNVLKIPEKNK